MVNRTRFFAICVTISNINFAHQKSMPIAINNSFPSIKMPIGLLSDDENKMSMLVDTGAAMNTSNRPIISGLCLNVLVWLLSISSAVLIPIMM